VSAHRLAVAGQRHQVPAVSGWKQQAMCADLCVPFQVIGHGGQQMRRDGYVTPAGIGLRAFHLSPGFGSHHAAPNMHYAGLDVDVGASQFGQFTESQAAPCTRSRRVATVPAIGRSKVTPSIATGMR
jgi:hypothetical protein